MGRALALEVFAVGCDGAEAHAGVADDEHRFLLFIMRAREGVGDGDGVVAVNFDYMPVPCAVFGGVVLAVDLVDVGRELHLVAVVEHYQVRQAEIACDAAGALRDFLLDAAVRDESVGLVSHDFAEAGGEEAFGDCGADGHRVALAQRARGVFNAARGVDFGVARRDAAPLAELL